MFARNILNQWKCAHDKSFDISLSFLKPEDGDEHWTIPPVQMIKAKTDAAIFASENQFSFSFVARDSAGMLKEARAVCKRGVMQPDLAEANGVQEALSWIKNNGWMEVLLESDCLVVVQAIRCSTNLLSYFGRVIQECIALSLPL